MKFIYDHDLHIHSRLSSCSKDPEQTNERILKYAEDNALNTICLTNHFWDKAVQTDNNRYGEQDFSHILKALPLPQSKKVRFLFGGETDMDRFYTLGVSREVMEKLDFIVIPTTHFHLNGFTISDDDASSAEKRMKVWINRLDRLLDMDLPFHKIGIAHLASSKIGRDREEYLKILDAIPLCEMERLFSKAASLGVGIELNSGDMNFKESEADTVLRLFRTAKNAGCKFYCGGDIHRPAGFGRLKAVFERAIDLLDLDEEDKIGLLKN